MAAEVRATLTMALMTMHRPSTRLVSPLAVCSVFAGVLLALYSRTPKPELAERLRLIPAFIAGLLVVTGIRWAVRRRSHREPT